MKRQSLMLLGVLAAAGCSSSGVDAEKLRDALNRSTVTLVDTIQTAEAEGADRTAVTAGIDLSGDPVWSINNHLEATNNLENVRIDLVGSVIDTRTLSQTSNGPCGGISLIEAIGIAEKEIGGEAVAIVPDDDDPCLSEIQVFNSDDVLWEVKLASDGSVVETEESDETLDGKSDEEDEADDEEE